MFLFHARQNRAAYVYGMKCTKIQPLTQYDEDKIIIDKKIKLHIVLTVHRMCNFCDYSLMTKQMQKELSLQTWPLGHVCCEVEETLHKCDVQEISALLRV